MENFEILCWKYIYYSIMYYQYNHSEASDSEYDNICVTLKNSWKKLPYWFKERFCLDDIMNGLSPSINPTKKELDDVENFLYNNIPIANIKHDNKTDRI